MKQVSLRGITWNHSRAFPPLVAVAQRFEEQHRNVEILWERRSLHEFGHADLSVLARSFDLLVIDHPMLGDVDRSGVLVDLMTMLSEASLEGLQQDALGPCLDSYRLHGKLYALPVDASAPAACFRPDLLESAGAAEPRTWPELLHLARRGCVRMPGFPADLFLNFLGLCVSRDSPVAVSKDQFLDRAVALRCLEDLREIASFMPETIYGLNPISLYEAMAAEQTIAYCPFAFTYSNYSRLGFAANRLRFSSPVLLEAERSMRTVLGGTGIAISSECKAPDLALEFCLFVAGRQCQGTIYAFAGGQPASAVAWQDETLNRCTGNFFKQTLSTIQSAYIRPRYAGYVRLQERAGLPIIEYLRNDDSADQAIDRIEEFYRNSLVEQ